METLLRGTILIQQFKRRRTYKGDISEKKLHVPKSLYCFLRVISFDDRIIQKL